MPMAKPVIIALFAAFALILASGTVADSSSRIPNPGLKLGGYCIDGLGICLHRNEDECKNACNKKWEFFNPEGYCQDYPGAPPLCYCKHDCVN
ncbi:hypothetical protein F511_14289 [Dorcoceras hygrometricum]|uniref:Uncharacterized protein n=1 Tax=Dorcoceras hygrometricum TaxID=472368 RepID=A0A2Z7BNX8_9LAMI|nr:hypothetical protein F511_14289 [Dorcoceras hygrometricum]